MVALSISVEGMFGLTWSASRGHEMIRRHDLPCDEEEESDGPV